MHVPALTISLPSVSSQHFLLGTVLQLFSLKLRLLTTPIQTSLRIRSHRKRAQPFEIYERGKATRVSTTLFVSLAICWVTDDEQNASVCLNML